METSYYWNDLDDVNKDYVINAHALGLKTAKQDTLIRLFDLGNPLVVIADDKTYCRIAEESKDVMKVLFNNYVR